MAERKKKLAETRKAKAKEKAEAKAKAKQEAKEAKKKASSSSYGKKPFRSGPSGHYSGGGFNQAGMVRGI